MVFVEVDSVVVLTSGQTTTSPVTTLAVLSNSTLTVRDVPSHLARFLISSHHDADLIIV